MTPIDDVDPNSPPASPSAAGGFPATTWLGAALIVAASAAGAAATATLPAHGAAKTSSPSASASQNPTGARPGSGLPAGVIFRINGTDITRDRFFDEMNQSLGESYRETFISHVLLDQRAGALGVVVKESDVEEGVTRRIEGTRDERFNGDITKLEDALKENGLTLDGWKKQLRVESRYDMLAEILTLKDRRITEEDVRRTFEEKHGKDGEILSVRHIQKNVAIASSPDYTLQQYDREKEKVKEEARTRAEEALAKLRNNVLFDTVLTTYSDDPRKVIGGGLGPFKGRFGEELDKAAASLTVNEISDVIPCTDGFRIVQCTAITDVEEVRAQHILVATGAKAKGRTEPESKSKAEKLLADLRKGADFTELAKEQSEDPASAPRGGDLGFFGRRAMLKPFEDVAFSLQPGQVSDIVKTGFGFHIIKVLEKRNSQDRTLRQIFISTQFPVVKERRLRPSMEAKARERLDEAIAELKKGAQFGDLAKKYSEDLTTKETGGQMRPYVPGVYGKEFDQAVKDAKVGAPQIVRDNAGNLHLLLVEGVVKTDFAKVRSNIEKELKERPVSRDEKADYIKKLRESAQVES